MTPGMFSASTTTFRRPSDVSWVCVRKAEASIQHCKLRARSLQYRYRAICHPVLFAVALGYLGHLGASDTRTVLAQPRPTDSLFDSLLRTLRDALRHAVTRTCQTAKYARHAQASPDTS
jgi:hypothetical protein